MLGTAALAREFWSGRRRDVSRFAFGEGSLELASQADDHGELPTFRGEGVEVLAADLISISGADHGGDFGAFHQRGGFNAVFLADDEATGSHEEERLEVFGEAVVLIQSRARQAERRGINATHHVGAVAHVCYDHVIIKRDAPAVEELLQVGLRIDHAALTTVHRILLLLAADGFSDEALRVNKADELAATEYELVNGKEGLVLDAGGVEAEQDGDVVVDLVHGGADFAHIVVEAKLVDEEPSGLILATLELSHRVIGAHDAHGTHDADDGLATAADLLHCAGHLILQEGLFLRVEEGEDFLLLEALHGHAEVEIVTFRVHLHPADVVFFGLVLVFGGGIGSETLQHQFAFRGFFKLQQEVHHGAGVVLQHGGHHAVLSGGVVADGDGFVRVQVFEDVLRA